MTTTAETVPLPVEVELINPLGYDDLEAAAAKMVAQGCSPHSLWLFFRRASAVGGSRPEVADRCRYRDYDETALCRSLPPGDYIAELQVIGEAKAFRGVRAIRNIKVDPAISQVGKSAAAQPPAPLPAVPAGSSSDGMLRFMEGMLARSEERTNKLIEALAKRETPPVTPVAQLLDLVEGMKKIHRSVERPPVDGGSEWAPLIREGLGALSQIGASMNAPRPAAPASLPASGGPPAPASPSPAQPSQGDTLAAMLLTGAKASDPQPGIYAALIADFIEATGVDVAAALDAAKPGDVAAQYAAAYPALAEHKPFLDQVETALRDLYADDEQETPQ